MDRKRLLMSIAVFISLFWPGISHATTYYVRPDGGSSVQCTGMSDAPYSGAGNSQPCAFNHPVWALGSPGTYGMMMGGDVLIIDDVNPSNGQQAQYMIGYGMPNTNSENCSIWQTYNCTMSPVPSG